jgi:hypothetical protein
MPSLARASMTVDLASSMLRSLFIRRLRRRPPLGFSLMSVRSWDELSLVPDQHREPLSRAGDPSPLPCPPRPLPFPADP